MAGGGADKPDKTSEETQKSPSAEGEESLVFDWVPVEDRPAKPAAVASPPARPAPKAPTPKPTPPAADAPPPQEPPQPPQTAAPDEAPLVIDVPPMPAHRMIPLPPRETKPAPPPGDFVPATVGWAPVLTPKPEPKEPAPTVRPEPRKPAPPPMPAAPALKLPTPAPTPPSRRARRAAAPALILVAAVGLLLVGAVFFALRYTRPPKVVSASPLRVRAGQVLTIRGENFGAQPQDSSARFDGKPGRVIRASTDQIEVEVPADIPTTPGQDTPLSVTVTSRGRETAPLKIASYQALEVRSLTPDVAMPGDEVVVSGRGWGTQVKVAFGLVESQVLKASPESLRVRVPALDAPRGTSVSVVVSAGADRSEPVPFLVGHLPLLSSVQPKAATAGDLLTLRGKGFDPQAGATVVEIGGERALVVSCGESEIKVVVPMVYGSAARETPVEVRVPGSQYVGASTVALSAPGVAVAFKFAAEPFADVAGHEHAALATELGPAFVLSSSGARSAVERALEAQRRLNEAGALLATTKDPTLEIRSTGTGIAIGLAGRPEPLLEVTEEDAAAYNETVGSFRGNAGRRVTRARLGAWWLALTRDLVTVLLSDARARQVAALTPEGHLLADLNDSARRLGSSGVPRKALESLRPETRKGLLALALRVPTAAGEASGKTDASAGSGPATEDPLQLEGLWSGTSTEAGVTKTLRVTFDKNGGTFTYLKPLQLTVPLTGVERPRMGSVRFSVRLGPRTNYYLGTWDGETLSGSISSAPDGNPVVGSFELRR